MAISEEVQKKLQKLTDLFYTYQEEGPASVLSDWDVQFTEDQTKRWEGYGDKTFISAKQLIQIDRLIEKLEEKYAC